MVGYHNNPKATAETVSPDGWLSTGDIGYYDENLEFYIVDRIKELIKVQGYQVGKINSEKCIKNHSERYVLRENSRFSQSTIRKTLVIETEFYRLLDVSRSNFQCHINCFYCITINSHARKFVPVP